VKERRRKEEASFAVFLIHSNGENEAVLAAATVHLVCLFLTTYFLLFPPPLIYASLSP